jgi:hypothetical protein
LFKERTKLNRGQIRSIKFREVSNIEQQLRNSKAHAGSITAPP